MPVWAMAKTEKRNPTPMMATSRSSHSHRVAFAFRLSGYGHNYMGDFQSAKQDFAVRSGLISKAQLFSPEELTELYRGTDYLLDEGPELEDVQLKALQTARTKIEYTVPDLTDRLEQGQEQEPQMDM